MTLSLPPLKPPVGKTIGMPSIFPAGKFSLLPPSIYFYGKLMIIDLGISSCKFYYKVFSCSRIPMKTVNGFYIPKFSVLEWNYAHWNSENTFCVCYFICSMVQDRCGQLLYSILYSKILLYSSHLEAVELFHSDTQVLAHITVYTHTSSISTSGYFLMWSGSVSENLVLVKTRLGRLFYGGSQVMIKNQIMSRHGI